MKKYIYLLLLSILSLSTRAQIFYSEKIPASELGVFKQIEIVLKWKPFTQQKVMPASEPIFSGISDYSKDSLFYTGIVQQFTDTSLINSLPESNAQNKQQNTETVMILKAYTLNSIISMHNIVSCVDNKILFVMPASEYQLTDPSDGRFGKQTGRLYVAGFFKETNYYPFLGLLFNADHSRITYITPLLNFEGYSKEKEEYFEKNISPLIKPCIRIPKVE